MRIKSRILSLLITLFFFGAVITSCSDSDDEAKKEDNKENITKDDDKTGTDDDDDNSSEETDSEEITVEGASVNKDGIALPISTDEIKDLVVGDADGDSDKDIVVAGGGSVEILQNHGGGNFTTTSADVPGVNKVVMADLNEDGVDDIIAASDTNFTVLLNNDGSVELALTAFSLEAFGLSTDDLLTKIASMVVADLDKDHDPDIIATVTDDDGDDKVLIFENNGDTDEDGEPEFEETPIADGALTDLEEINQVEVADVDGDGDLDLVFSGADANDVPVISVLAKVDEGESDGIEDFEIMELDLSFDQICDDLEDSNDPCEITDFGLADVEEDSDMDITIIMEKGDEKSLLVLEQQDDNTFEAKDISPDNEDDLQNISVEDIDGDGDTDLVLATCTGDSSEDDELTPIEYEILWDDDEDEVFRFASFDLPGCTEENEDSFADFEIDDLDWFSDKKDECGEENDLFVSDGNNIFLFPDADTVEKDGTPMTADELENGAAAIASLDADSDDDTDLVAATDDGLILLTNNEGAADANTENFIGSVISTEDLGEVTSITPMDVDGDGDEDFIVSGTKGLSTWLNTAGDFVKKETSVLGDIGSKVLNFFSMSKGDVDGDGDTDILATGDTDGDGENEAVLLSNDGSGAFTPTFDIVETGTKLAKSVLSDIGGDGILDIFTTSSKADSGGDSNLASSAISLFKGLGSSLFGTGKEVADTPSGCEATDMVSVNADGDDDQDIAVSDDCGNITVVKDDEDDADKVEETTIPAEALGSSTGSPITSLIKTGVGALTSLVSPKEQAAGGSTSESTSSPMDIVKSAVSSDTGKMLISTATTAIGGLFSNFGSSSNKTTVVETPVEEEKKSSGGFFSSLTSGVSKLFSFF